MFEDFVDSFLNLDIIRRAMPILWRGLLQTLLLAAIVVPLGLLHGMAIALLSRASSRWVRWPLAVWTDTFRALPPLVLLIFLYAGLPFLGVDLGPWGAVALAFFLNTGSYYGEVLRAGLDSVPPGQMEAARALGLRPALALWLVVIPQAVRNVLPDLVSNTLEVVKLTSIASVVAVPELLFQARQAQSVTYNASPIVAAALAYFIILWPVVRLLSRLENRAVLTARG
ncbi:amino acid ABC transporter permease [Pararoseomonas baculiformis]